jgi:hypothetical protein
MLQGRCLCGGVTFEITGEVPGVTLCHCSLCRQVSGVGSTATIWIKAEQLRWITGQELVQEFQRPSGYGTSFCRTCGSPAPDPNRSRTIYGIPIGVLAGNPPLKVTEHIFVRSKAEWDVIGDAAPCHDEFPPKGAS